MMRVIKKVDSLDQHSKHQKVYLGQELSNIHKFKGYEEAVEKCNILEVESKHEKSQKTESSSFLTNQTDY